MVLPGDISACLKEAPMCRHCIGKVLGREPQREVCRYHIYPQQCSVCKRMKRIVIGFSPGGYLGMLLRGRRKSVKAFYGKKSLSTGKKAS